MEQTLNQIRELIGDAKLWGDYNKDIRLKKHKLANTERAYSSILSNLKDLSSKGYNLIELTQLAYDSGRQKIKVYESDNVRREVQEEYVQPSNVNSTPAIHDFLKQVMVKEFYYKWGHAWDKNCTKAGSENEYINDYVQAMNGGKGYTGSEIKKAIDSALTWKYLPTPRDFNNILIEGRSTKQMLSHSESHIITAAEKERIKQIMESIQQDDAIAIINQLKPQGERYKSANEAREHIDICSQKLLEMAN